MLRLAVAASRQPHGLAAYEGLQYLLWNISGDRQRDAIGTLDAIAVTQSQVGREATLIAHDESAGAGFHQRFPRIRRVHHAAQELGIQTHHRA